MVAKADAPRQLMIEWTEQASRQLDQVYEYITRSNSEDVAERIVRRIVSKVEQLASFPLSGRKGRVPQYA